MCEPLSFLFLMTF